MLACCRLASASKVLGKQAVPGSLPELLCTPVELKLQPERDIVQGPTKLKIFTHTSFSAQHSSASKPLLRAGRWSTGWGQGFAYGSRVEDPVSANTFILDGLGGAPSLPH